jgi:trimethylamine corrinoid protein
MSNDKLFKKARQAVFDGDMELAIELAKEGLADDIDPAEFIEKGFVPGILEIGDLFERGEVFLPEVLMAAEAIKGAVEILNEAIIKSGKKKEAAVKVVLATVEGDLHDIGKGIVASLMIANGFDVIDLGRDVSSQKIVDTAIEIGADVIGSSALLITTMAHQREIEELLTEKGLKGKIKTIIGGAPVSESWRDKIGADWYGETASDSINLINKYIKQKNIV